MSSASSTIGKYALQVGASIALSPGLAHASPIPIMDARLVSNVSVSERIRDFDDRMYFLRADVEQMGQSTFAPTDEEVSPDYSYMALACERAANSGDFDEANESMEAYKGLSTFSYELEYAIIEV